MENKVFFVYSDAGYGSSVRGAYPNQKDADLKMARLSKKGHINVEVHEAQILKITKHGADS